ncbi:MAG TPA: YfiR family protein [Polyangiaceae bacterium]
MERRSVLRSALAATTFLFFSGKLAAEEDVGVPVPLQMELLVKVAGYDKNLPARARGVVRVAVLTRRDEAQSKNVAQQAIRALSGKSVKGLPVEVSELGYGDGAAVARAVKERGISILYVAPGFGTGDLQSIAKALGGVSVLSAGALARFVENGVVLCFDLVGGKPKLLIHLRRAREQGVDLSSQVLKLAKVIE